MFRRIAFLAVAAAALTAGTAMAANAAGSRIIGGGDDMEIVRDTPTVPTTASGQPVLVGGGDDMEILRR